MSQAALGASGPCGPRLWVKKVPLKRFAPCTPGMKQATAGWARQAEALPTEQSTRKEKWSPTVPISFVLPCGGKTILRGHRESLLIKMGNKRSEQ